MDAEIWTYEYSDERLGWVLHDENGLLVAIVPDQERAREDDARCMAAAPRLRACTRALLNASDDRPSAKSAAQARAREALQVAGALGWQPSHLTSEQKAVQP